MENTISTSTNLAVLDEDRMMNHSGDESMAGMMDHGDDESMAGMMGHGDDESMADMMGHGDDESMAGMMDRGDDESMAGMMDRGSHENYELPLEDAPMAPPEYPESIENARLHVRKSVTDLDADEIEDYVEAVDALKNTYREGSTISIYDELVSVHVGAMGMMLPETTGPAGGHDAAHTLPAFLPWHREYLDRLEAELQKINPNVTLPYWDWTDPEALDVMYQENFLGDRGRGVEIDIPGRGTYEGGPVETGAFADWELNENINIDFLTLESDGTKLTRFVGLPPADNYPISQSEIDSLLEIDDYEIFRVVLEGEKTIDSEGNIQEDVGLHNYGHGLLGGMLFNDLNAPPSLANLKEILGTMANLISAPYDPVFWIHHSSVDRLWAEWQADGHTGENFYPDSGMPYGHNLNEPMWPWDNGQSQTANFGSEDFVSLIPEYTNDVVTPSDTLDIRKYGYTYDTLIEDFPISVDYYIVGSDENTDYLLGTDVEDAVKGLANNDTLDGKDGDDVLLGGEGHDILEGGNGSDFLFGEMGDDSLVGGEGDDELDGGTGKDILTGGEGANTFIFTDLNNEGDIITDFSVEEDLLMFSSDSFGNDLMIGETINCEQFITDVAATTIEQRFIYNSHNGNLFYDADGSGELGQQLVVNLSDIPNLSHENFSIA